MIITHWGGVWNIQDRDGKPIGALKQEPTGPAGTPLGWTFVPHATTAIEFHDGVRIDPEEPCT